eukprot:gene11480-13385_t
MKEAQKQYNQIMIDASNEVNRGSTLFAAVVQPGPQYVQPVRNLMSELDCFHINVLGAQNFAIELEDHAR